MFHNEQMKSDHQENLFRAFSLLDTEEDVKQFMLDLCTPKEIGIFAERWEIAQLLNDREMSYREIAKQTGASTTTVARVARFLNNEPHKGYKLALGKISQKQ